MLHEALATYEQVSQKLKDAISEASSEIQAVRLVGHSRCGLVVGLAQLLLGYVIKLKLIPCPLFEVSASLLNKDLDFFRDYWFIMRNMSIITQY